MPEEKVLLQPIFAAMFHRSEAMNGARWFIGRPLFHR
jgi:hypothetical protein